MRAGVARATKPAPRREAAEIALVPVSAGELIDKIAILTIKTERARNAHKRLLAAQELALLREAAAPLLEGELAGAIAPLKARIKAVNLALWQVEDDLRALERAQDFGARFIELARKVYRANDERARLKNEINAAAGGSLMEAK